MSERLRTQFIQVEGAKVRRSYFEQVLKAYGVTGIPGRLGRERLTSIEFGGNTFDLSSVRLRKGSIIADAFSELNKQNGPIDKEVQFKDPTAWAIKQAVRCAVLAEGRRHERASEAARKGWEKRRDNFRQSPVAVENLSESRQPSGISGIIDKVRPFANKVRKSVLSVLAAGGVLLPSFINSTIIYADSTPPQVDLTIQQRAAVVGGYLPTMEQIARQAAIKAGELLGREVDPASIEAGRLGVQYRLEALANELVAEEHPEDYRRRIEDRNFELGLGSQTVQSILNAEETNGQPRLPELQGNSDVALFQRAAHYLRGQEKPGSRALVFVSLNEQGGGSEEERRLIERAAEMVGVFGVPTGNIVHVVAEANNNPFGSSPAAIGAIAANHAKAE